jgi:hypothetical protein
MVSVFRIKLFIFINLTYEFQVENELLNFTKPKGVSMQNMKDSIISKTRRANLYIILPTG